MVRTRLFGHDLRRVSMAAAATAAAGGLRMSPRTTATTTATAAAACCQQNTWLSSMSMSKRWHGGGPSVSSSSDAAEIAVTFVQPDGSLRTVAARVGESLLQTAHRHEIDLEGACEGVCACSTCHLILPLQLYDSLPEPSEDEEDMLDLAFGLTETSRLGCQIIVDAQTMDGVELQMPAATRNFYVDGHVPKPH